MILHHYEHIEHLTAPACTYQQKHRLHRRRKLRFRKYLSDFFLVAQRLEFHQIQNSHAPNHKDGNDGTSGTYFKDGRVTQESLPWVAIPVPVRVV